jgi:hypothetical protein
VHKGRKPQNVDFLISLCPLASKILTITHNMSSQPGSHTADADIPNKAQQEAPQGKKENMAEVTIFTIAHDWAVD